MTDLILRAWKNKNAFFYFVLIPLSWVFFLVTALRRYAYKAGLLPSYALPVPVIVVGNINMGGSGKTPVVIWLVEQLKKNGYSPGVISRGYGVNNHKPVHVDTASVATEVGDEPLLIARRTACPVWVSKNRVGAARALLQAEPTCNVIISDDGMQHYRLQRDLEVAVVDDEAATAHHLLPAGPLRESRQRLDSVDIIISHGEKKADNAFEMQLQGKAFYNLANSAEKVTADYFQKKEVKALAGIGKPERFFNTLNGLGLDFEGLRFDDHHAFTAKDLQAITADVIVMTEKDAVKCQAFAEPQHWVFPIEAQMEATLLPAVLTKLKEVTKK